MKPYKFEDDNGNELAVHSGGNYAEISADAPDGGRVRVHTSDALPLVQAIMRAADLPAVTIVHRVTPPLGGPWRPWEGSDLAVSRRDRGVLLKAGSLLMAPAKAREMAAVLVAYADEAENEPDPAEVDALAKEIRAALYPDSERIGLRPSDSDRTAARAALRWMRDREAKS